MPFIKGALRGFWIKKFKLGFVIFTGKKKYLSFPYWGKSELFSEENKVPRTLFEARKVAGSATYKQSETVLNCAVLYVRLFSRENK